MSIIDLAAFRGSEPPGRSDYVEPEWVGTPDGAEATLREIGRCSVRAVYLVESVGIQEAASAIAGPSYELIHSDETVAPMSPDLAYSVGEWLFRLPPRTNQLRVIHYTKAGLTEEEAKARLERELSEAAGRLEEWCNGILFLGVLQLSLLWNGDIIATAGSLGLLPFHDVVTASESRAARRILRDTAPRLFRDGTNYLRTQNRERPRRAKSRRSRRPTTGETK
jgi:hypothetical protein